MHYFAFWLTATPGIDSRGPTVLQHQCLPSHNDWKRRLVLPQTAFMHIVGATVITNEMNDGPIYSSYISNIPQIHLKQTSNIPQLYLKYISNIPQTCHPPDLSRQPGDASQHSHCCLPQSSKALRWEILLKTAQSEIVRM